MHQGEKSSLDATGRCVEDSEAIRFESQNRDQAYDWVEQLLVQQKYSQQGKAARGLLRRYLERFEDTANHGRYVTFRCLLRHADDLPSCRASCPSGTERPAIRRR